LWHRTVLVSRILSPTACAEHCDVLHTILRSIVQFPATIPASKATCEVRIPSGSIAGASVYSPSESRTGFAVYRSHFSSASKTCISHVS
jgi:hypothetical protein